MLSELHFIRPEWFYALIPVVLLSLLIFNKSRRHSGWEKVCDPALLKFQTIDSDTINSTARSWLGWLIPVLLFITVIALAGPSWSKKQQPVFQKNTPLVIILDLSYSMNAADIKPTRLERSRLKIIDILQSRSEGQSALIAFAGDTHIVSPLTIDNKTIISLLPALSSSIMPVPGSQLSDGLGVAEQLLKNAGTPNGNIIVFTDAVDDQQAYLKATQLRNQGYRVSVIGVGTAAGSPVPAPDQNGFIKDNLGQTILSKLDPGSLEQLANAGGGEFHTLSLDDADFQHVLNTDQLNDEAIKQQDDQIEQWIDQGAYITLLILPFTLLAFRKGLLMIACILIIIPAMYTKPAFSQVPLTVPIVNKHNDTEKHSSTASTANFWDYLWTTPDQKGQQLYNQQDYAGAAQHFENKQWKAGANYRSGDFQQAIDDYTSGDKADSWYNRANALANLGQFNAAVKAYDEALKRAPEMKDALANKDYIEELLAKQQQQDNNSQNQDSENQPQNQSSDNQSQQDSQQDSQAQDQQQQQDQNSQPQNAENEQQKQSDDSQSQQQDSAQQDSQQQEQQAQQQDNQKGETAKDPAQSKQMGTEQAAAQHTAEQQNEQNQPQEEQSQPRAAENKQDQMPMPEAKQTQPQHAQSADSAQPDSVMENQQNNESEPPVRDIMSQLSKEQQQSLNQWLQRIPDDPSELLRRKFYINSQIRQRQQTYQPQNKGNPW